MSFLPAILRVLGIDSTNRSSRHKIKTSRMSTPALQLELLEDRFAPATVVAAGDGFWDEQSTWIGNQIPRQIDDVVIPDRVFVQVRQRAVATSVTVERQVFRIPDRLDRGLLVQSNQQLIVSGAVTIDGYTRIAGTLDAGSVTVTGGGAFRSWVSGGGGINLGNGLTVSGRINSSQNIVVSNGGNFYLAGGRLSARAQNPITVSIDSRSILRGSGRIDANVRSEGTVYSGYSGSDNAPNPTRARPLMFTINDGQLRTWDFTNVGTIKFWVGTNTTSKLLTFGSTATITGSTVELQQSYGQVNSPRFSPASPQSSEVSDIRCIWGAARSGRTSDMALGWRDWRGAGWRLSWAALVLVG